MSTPLPGERTECQTCELLLGAGWQAGEDYALQNAILQNSPLAIIATDLAGTIIYFNPAAQKMLGYRWEEVVGRHSPTLFHLEHELRHGIHPSQTGGFEVFIEQLRHAGQGKGCESRWTYVRKDGTQFPVSVSLSCLRNGEGEVIGYLGIASDISQYQALEHELRITATAFESQAAIMVTDTQQRILRVNAAFSRLTGYSADEAVGQLPSLLKSGRQDASFYRALWTTLRREGHWQGEIWNRRKNGEIFPEWLTISEVRDGNGLLTHYVSSPS